MIKKKTKVITQRKNGHKDQYKVQIPMVFVDALEIGTGTEVLQELDLDGNRIILNFKEVNHENR